MVHRVFRRKSATCALVLLASASIMVIGQHVRRATPAGSAEQLYRDSAIQAVRLIPAGDPGGEIECDALEWVNLCYQISNHGRVPVTGLKLGTTCACEAVGALPDKLSPGESSTFRFRVRAPRVGKMQRKIPLLADGAGETLALLDISLYVKFKPPAFVSPMQDLTVKFVAGDRSPHEIVLDTTESKQASPWIWGVALEPSEGIRVEQVRMEELPEADPVLTRRRYRFALVNRSLSVGRIMISGLLQTDRNLPAVQEPLIIWADVVDPVAIVPNPLVIRYSKKSAPQSQRVCVVDRTGARVIATPTTYDQHLLRIERAGGRGGSTAAFNLLATQAAESPSETQVEFMIRGNETRKLVVRFEPSERP